MKVLKKGIDTITNIILIIFLSIIIIAMLNLNKSNTRNLNLNYLNIYAQNLLKSSTEFSILNVLGHDFNNGCPETITIEDHYFKVKGYYHFFLTDCNECNNCTKIETKDLNGTFILDLFLTSKVPNYNISIEKKTIQNP